MILSDREQVLVYILNSQVVLIKQGIILIYVVDCALEGNGLKIRIWELQTVSLSRLCGVS